MSIRRSGCFPGQPPSQPLTERSVQKVCTRSLKTAGITKAASVHTLRHYLPFRTMSGNARIFAEMMEIADQIEKSLIQLPDIVFRLQTVEESPAADRRVDSVPV